MTLCQATEGNANAFACIFHGWTFGLDGSLRGVLQPGGLCRDRRGLSLDRPGQVDTYQGFVFANQSGTAGSLAEHLGPGGMALLDWVCALSPSGQLQITAGWIGQQSASNWKMWAESDLDGYHLARLHSSLWRVVPVTQYEAAVLAGENKVTTTPATAGEVM